MRNPIVESVIQKLRGCTLTESEYAEIETQLKGCTFPDHYWEVRDILKNFASYIESDPNVLTSNGDCAEYTYKILAIINNKSATQKVA